MMELFDHLFSAAQIWLATFMGVFLRVGACFFVLPGLGEQMIPVRIRLGAALAMAVLLTPMLRDEVRISGLMPSGEVFLSEAAIGLCLGLALRFVVYALQTAGNDRSAGHIAQPDHGRCVARSALPAMGAILSMAGIALVVLSRAACPHGRGLSCSPMSYFRSADGRTRNGPRGLGRFKSVSASFRARVLALCAVSHRLAALQRGAWRHQQGHAAADGRLCRSARRSPGAGVALLMLVTPAILAAWLPPCSRPRSPIPWAAPMSDEGRTARATSHMTPHRGSLSRRAKRERSSDPPT
jgi:hypothetical protein